jgi:hypothetical protein
MTTINVRLEFSRYPAGRYAKDGPYTGEAFRNKLLIPALNAGKDGIVVEFDGTRGLGSSFLEEAFGGLVRKEGFDKEMLLARFEFHSADPSIPLEVMEYIKKAVPEPVRSEA